MTEKIGVYDRQESMELKIPESVHVLGVGGVGLWVAVNAALLGIPNIHVYDGDKLEYHNRNRLPYPSYEVGQDKTTLCANFIKKFRSVNVVEHPYIEEPRDVLDMYGLIMNCIDYPFKVDIQKFADEKNIWTLGANSTRYSITNKLPKSTSWSISDVSTYTGICAPTVSMIAAHAMGIATSGIEDKVSLSFDIRWVGNEK